MVSVPSVGRGRRIVICTKCSDVFFFFGVDFKEVPCFATNVPHFAHCVNHATGECPHLGQEAGRWQTFLSFGFFSTHKFKLLCFGGTEYLTLHSLGAAVVNFFSSKDGIYLGPHEKLDARS